MTMIMAEIIETTGQPTVAYGAILKLDRQTRHHSIPFGLEWPNPDGETKTRYEPIGRTIQRAFGSIFTQMSIYPRFMSERCSSIHPFPYSFNGSASPLSLGGHFETEPQFNAASLLAFSGGCLSWVGSILSEVRMECLLTGKISASSLVSSTLTIWRAFPGVIERIAPFWSHCHSGAVSSLFSFFLTTIDILKWVGRV